MKRTVLGSLCAALLSAGPAQASQYQITAIGLFDLEHTSDTGYQYSPANPASFNDAGQAAGIAYRYNGTSTQRGYSVWFYNGNATVKVGLTANEHTRAADGYQHNSFSFLNASGQVAGIANRYSSTSQDRGYSAWLYNGTSTLNVGLTDAEHTRSNGYRGSGVSYLNDAGQVAGNAERFNGSIQHGTTAWLYNGSSTVNVGLLDSEHTRDDGYRSSQVSALNEAGYVAGTASRHNGTAYSLGSSAWLYDGSSTVKVGLTGAEHTRSNGHKSSGIQHLNAAGQVAGWSVRYNGDTTSGQSSWLYSGNTTINIGLVGTEHTHNDGYQNNSIRSMNAAGQVAGTAMRYNGMATYLGQTAWLYNGSSTVDVGLVDVEHTRHDGYRHSNVSLQNDAGHVVGTAQRYNGQGILRGQSVWLYDGHTTVNVGLTGAEHTRDDGYKSSSVSKLNEAGQVAGTAIRYDGTATDLGRSAWLYDGSETVHLGLTDEMYTRHDGYQRSGILFLNEAGQVAGFSDRYNGTSQQMGQSAWFYDSTMEELFTLDFSVRDGGFAYSTISYLGDDGLVLGTYSLFDDTGYSLGSRAFSFSIEDGAQDLGALVHGGLDDAGWALLAGASRANDLGQIIGYGLLEGGSGQISYILTPMSPVPLPGAVWLLGSGLLGLVGVARRRKGC